MPISTDLKAYTNFLIEKHNEALDWNKPAGNLLWGEKEISLFKKLSKKLYFKICDELGVSYSIEFKDEMV